PGWQIRRGCTRQDDGRGLLLGGSLRAREARCGATVEASDVVLVGVREHRNVIVRWVTLAGGVQYALLLQREEGGLEPLAAGGPLADAEVHGHACGVH